MKIEIRDITNNLDHHVPVVYFIPKNFNKKPLLGNCRYAELSKLCEIKLYQDSVELISHRTPIIKQESCEKILIYINKHYMLELIDDSVFITSDLSSTTIS